MTANELRQKYLEFLKFKGHTIIPSASLIPENDPTVLFTTAGMHPLVPYLMGEKHPAGTRLTDAQKCIRTSDIDEVGDNRHLTFFEMLGNWSLGDYFKKEAIEWSWEFLTSKEWLGLNPQRLYVTVFAGDEKAEEDKDSIKFWQEQFAKAGISAKVCQYHSPVYGTVDYRIFAMPVKDNWWGPAGETGPCGPCTEMFYDTEPQIGALQKTFDEEINDFRVMEVWNDVFMEFNKKVKNEKQSEYELLKEKNERIPDNFFEYVKLSQKNVDTGMGLERTISVLNGKKDAFDNELFYPLIQKIEELSGRRYGIKITSPRLSPSKGEEEILFNPLFPKGGEDITRAMRIIADHVKAATFILGDDKGLTPSNVGAGYVLRRLIRRAVRYGKQLGINEIFTFKIAEEVVKIYQSTYAELKKNKEFIVNQLVKEEEKFRQVIQEGLKKADRIVSQKKNIGQELFNRIMGLSVNDKKEAFRKLYLGGQDQNNFSVLFNIPIANEDILNATIIGKEAFDLYQAYGFPIEMIIELAQEKNLFVDVEGFEEEFRKHQELSHTASAGMFKGGLADASEATVRFHTAAHLMLAALRQVLGEGVVQKGSNITPERLRFDFSHGEKMTPEQIKQVEDIVNEKIKEDLAVNCEEMTLDEAKAKGAMGVFESKYGERVKVYSVGDFSTSSKDNNIFSREICGGPHVERTGALGKFKITKEESISAGVRRIKAVLE